MLAALWQTNDGSEELENVASLSEARHAIGSRYLPALQYPDYRKLWLGTVCSQSSAWALIVARGALAKSLTDSDMWVGLVTFSAMIPSVVMSPIAGYLADRFDRRTVLAGAYIVNLTHNFLLAMLVITGNLGEAGDDSRVWILVVLSLINGSARTTQMPAAQALLANTVPRERLFNAVALYQTTQQGSRFFGPFLVLVLLWVTGPWVADNQDWVFFLCTALYLVGLVLILKVRTASTGVVSARRGTFVVLHNLVEGLRFAYSNRLVLSLLFLVVAHCGMTMSFESLFPAISTEKLGMEPGAGILAGFGYLMVGFGAGALVTSMALAGLQSEKTRGHMFLFMGVLSGASLIALAASPNLPLAFLSVVLMGASQGGFMTLSTGMMQALAPDAIRGRLMSVNSWHTQGFMASFNLVNGTLAAVTALTAPIILGAGGLAFFWVMILSFARVPLRQIYARGIPAEARPVQAQTSAT